MQTSIIVGCGYLGGRVAKRLVAADQEVVGVVNSFDHARQLELEGVRAVVADVTRRETLDEAFDATLGDLPPVDTVFYCVGHNPQSGPQSGISPQELHVDGLGNLLAVLPAGVRRFIYAGSTSVYGQHDGAWVDEDSPCRPTTDAGKIRLAAERVLLLDPIAQRSIILRLAGIYGAERLARRAQRLSKSDMIGADEYLNLIHVDDAAEVVAACSKNTGWQAASGTRIGGLSQELPRTFLVSDGHPLTRQEFLALLGQWRGWQHDTATEIPASVTSSSPRQRRSIGSKRVDNSRMLRELGILLSYPSASSFFADQARPEK